MTEPLDSERPNIQLGNVYSNIVELNRIVPSIIEKMIDEKLRQAPEWFTSEINNMNNRLTSMDDKLTSLKSDVASLKTDMDNKFTSLKSDVASLKTDMDNKFALVDSRFVKLEYNHLCLFNSFRRMNGYEAVSVPFLNREENQEELPLILSVQDIDRLTKEECQRFLTGYYIQFHPNETIKLKEKLREAVGLMARYDYEYKFTTFPTSN